MSDTLKPCPLCGGEGAPEGALRIGCIGDCGFCCANEHWNALPRHDETAAEVAREMQEAVSQLLDDDAVPGPAVLDWSARLRQCAEPVSVSAHVWVADRRGDQERRLSVRAEPPQASAWLGDDRVLDMGGVQWDRTQVHGVYGSGTPRRCNCPWVTTPVRCGHCDGEVLGELDGECERCETPLADTAHCSACVEELDSAVARLRRERDEWRTRAYESGAHTVLKLHGYIGGDESESLEAAVKRVLAERDAAIQERDEAQKRVEDLQLRVQALRQDREDAVNERDEILAEFNQRNERLEKAKERYKAGTQKKCVRCGVPITYTATCSLCVDELSVAVARLRQERDEARRERDEAKEGAEMTAKGREEFRRAMLDNARMASRYLRACKRMHREWREVAGGERAALRRVQALRTELDRARAERDGYADRARLMAADYDRGFRDGQRDRPEWRKDKDGDWRAEWMGLELMALHVDESGERYWAVSTPPSTGFLHGFTKRDGCAEDVETARNCAEGAARDYLGEQNETTDEMCERMQPSTGPSEQGDLQGVPGRDPGRDNAQAGSDDQAHGGGKNGRLNRAEWLRRARDLHAEVGSDDCASETATVCWYVIEKLIRAMETDR